MINAGLYSSGRGDWGTPPDFFARLDGEFRFTLDVCASDWSAKCGEYYTVEDDGLARRWVGRCWMNPPYGREIGRWVEKASRGEAELVVGLVPARTDTRWWHDYVMRAREVRFVRGRLRFWIGGEEGGSAPFPSAIVVWRGEWGGVPEMGVMDARPGQPTII